MSLAKPQEMSNSVWAFATAGVRGEGQLSLIRYVADAFSKEDGSLVSNFKPQELSNTAWAVATLLSKRQSISASELDQNVLEDECVRGILLKVCQSLITRVVHFKPQEISNTLWAFATVGFGCNGNYFNPNGGNIHDANPLSLGASRQVIDQDRECLNQCLEIVANNVLHRLPRFSPQELNNLAWAFARLGHKGEATDTLFNGIGLEIEHRHRQFAPQDVGTTLWSFATMGYTHETVFTAAASRLSLEAASKFKPQEASNSIWALATAGIQPKYLNAFDTTLIPAKANDISIIRKDPITQCFAAVAREIMRRPNAFKEQELKDVLWGFSKAGVRHPLLFKRVAEHLVGDSSLESKDKPRGLEGFTPQGLGNLAWSYARQAQLADAATSLLKQQGIFTSISNGRLAVYETSCIDVGEGLINLLFKKIAEIAIRNQAELLLTFKPQDLSNTAWAFATLGLLHLEFFQAISDQVTARLAQRLHQQKMHERFKAQELTNLVWSFATLNFRAPLMLDKISSYIVELLQRNDECSIAELFNRQELANMAWSCAVLEHYPAKLMPLLYKGLVGDNRDNNSERLKLVFRDNGLQKQAVMSLLYVQMAIEFEAPHLDLSLPDNFPHGLAETSSEKGTTNYKSNQNTDVDRPMLELSISRLQETVSRALHRVNFSHVQEHVLGTDALLQTQDINPISLHNFLSIDIANIHDKIGIEVDGPAHFINILDGALKNQITVNGTQNQMGRRQENGPTALKHRLLCHLGWDIIHMPYWEWSLVAGNESSENNYCRKLVEKHL